VGEEAPERLAELLDRRPALDGVAVVQWRFDLGIGWSLQAGLKDGRLGGPYEPPSAARGFGGSIYLRWSDGSVTRGMVDGRTLDAWDESLAEWRANAFADPDAPDVLPPPPEPLPVVQTADPGVEALVDGHPLRLIEPLDRARERLGRAGVRRLRADSSAARGRRFLAASTGLRVSYPETAAALYLAAEDRYWRSFSKRRWYADDELEELLDDAAETTSVLLKDATAPIGEVPVLLRPGVASSFLGSFLVANLGGSAVVNRRSAWSLDDFRGGCQVLREDLDLTIDTLLDLEGAASPISSEGVPGGRATLIERGRLVRPAVDLKYARRSGFPPTPVPGGAPGTLLRGARPVRTAARVRSELPTALELHAALGLHSQDSASGRYSVVAAHSQVIQAGRPIGGAKVSLVGSFFDHLLDERTELVAYPWGLNPGLLIWTTVERQA
jgi:PmbA protein